MNGYALWKFIHVLSATILMGTGIGIAFFCWFGYRRAIQTQDIGALRNVLRLTVTADFCFTAPAVVVQFVSGSVLMHLQAWSWSSSWARYVVALFALVGACWLPVVWIQMQLAKNADQVPATAGLPDKFHRLFRIWFALGVPAFIGVITIVYLMVVKPATLFG